MAIARDPRTVVTGAGSGLGRAFCEVLARRGARLVCADINLESARETASLCGGGAVAVACDVSKIDDVVALADEAERRFGGVDLIINNAGVAVAGRVGEVALDDWRWILSINLWGVIHGCHVFVPRLRRQRSGHIINVASTAGLISPPQMAPYNVTKAGVVSLSETLFAELRDDGVGVTVLCPTFVKTNLHHNTRGVKDPSVRAVFSKLIETGTSAEGVITAALDAAAAGELYVTPQPDARWLWRFKRAAPTRFHSLSPTLMKLRLQRLGLTMPE
jgi:NAD(P)-dependent dehydrogenase (short-subunit alcohol dehydrogenase family)